MPSFAKQIKSLLWQLGSALCCDVLISDFRQLKYLLSCLSISFDQQAGVNEQTRKTKNKTNGKSEMSYRIRTRFHSKKVIYFYPVIRLF